MGCLMITLVLTLDVMSIHVCGWQILIELVNVVLLIQIFDETSSECLCIGVCILWRKGPEGSGKGWRRCEGRAKRDPVRVEDGVKEGPRGIGRSRRQWNIVMCTIDVCVHYVCIMCVICVLYGGHPVYGMVDIRNLYYTLTI